MKTYTVKVDNNGDTFWYNEKGKLHRENGPAKEYTNGDKVWYKEGNIHRENGPAVEWNDGTKTWYLNGKQLTEEEFNNRNSCEGKIVEIDGKKYRLQEV